MRDKDSALLQDVAEEVHGDPDTSEKAMRKNANRTSESLAELQSRLSFRVAGGMMHKEINHEPWRRIQGPSAFDHKAHMGSKHRNSALYARTTTDDPLGDERAIAPDSVLTRGLCFVIMQHRFSDGRLS
jgi:hypothetical protein